MRNKFIAAIVLSGAVLGISASAFAAQDSATTRHRAHSAQTSVQKQAQPAPRYYDYYYDQSQGTDAVGGAGSALGGIGH